MPGDLVFDDSGQVDLIREVVGPEVREPSSRRSFAGTEFFSPATTGGDGIFSNCLSMTDVLQKLVSLQKRGDGYDSAPTVSRAVAWRDRLAPLLPVALVLGFAILFFIVVGDRLLPAREVVLETVVTLETGAGASLEAAPADPVDPADAAMLFQASGWVEPDPLPVKATALIDGVVEEVNVLEGDTVKKGQLLATLIADDAKLNLLTAESRLVSLRASAEAQDAQTTIIEAEVATLEKQVAAATARRAELEDQVRRVDSVAASGSGAVAEREVVLARLRLATQSAEVEALIASGDELSGRLRQQEAIIREFDARIAEAETEVERRRLELERTRIVSPLDGAVLRLVAVPGEKRMLGMDHTDSSTIAILYQPEHLQVRIDVPLAEASKLAVGQMVRLRSGLLADQVFFGEVTRIAGEADLQRNTLQVKVRIVDPDPRLRPEMLCRAEFLAPRTSPESEGGDASVPRGGLSLFVPETALAAMEGNRATVWRIDESGDRVVAGEVVLGEERRETYRLVIEGLRPGDRVVVDPPADLENGERVRATR